MGFCPGESPRKGDLGISWLLLFQPSKKVGPLHPVFQTCGNGPFGLRQEPWHPGRGHRTPALRQGPQGSWHPGRGRRVAVAAGLGLPVLDPPGPRRSAGAETSQHSAAGRTQRLPRFTAVRER